MSVSRVPPAPAGRIERRSGDRGLKYGPSVSAGVGSSASAIAGVGASGVAARRVGARGERRERWEGQAELQEPAAGELVFGHVFASSLIWVVVSSGSSGAEVRGIEISKVAPPPGRRSRGDRSAVRLGDGRDDRQAEADAAARARAGLVGTVEALERPRRLLLGQPGAGVRDGQNSAVLRRPRAARQPASRPACARDVREQVVDELPEPVAVAGDDGGLRLERDRPAGIDGERGVDGLGDDRVELDRLPLERPALVEPGEQEQVVDEQAHPLRLAADAAHRAGEVVRPPVGAAEEQLGVRAHGGERRAQLVRRVGDEAPEPLLGRRLGVEGTLDLRRASR